jgi:two-component system response regulator RegX3
MARVVALLRRSAPRPVLDGAPFTFGAWRINPAARSAVHGRECIDLTVRELALLGLFARERGRIVSRRQLLVEVWGMQHVESIQTRTVDMHIAKLRKKLASDAGNAIETIRGEGYRFVG